MHVVLALLVAVAAAAPAAAAPPDWQPPPAGAFSQSMAVTGVVRVRGVELRSPDDRVAAFVGGQIRGVAAPTLVGSRRIFFLSVAGEPGDGPVTFRAYDATADQVIDVVPTVTFDSNRPVGTATNPLVWTPATGEPPAWTVDPAAYEGSMSVTAAVREGGVEVTEAGTLVGAFVGGQLRGSASLQSAGTAGWRAFVTVYGNAGETGAVTFQTYRPSLARSVALVGSTPFALGGRVGTISAPLVLTLPTGVTLTGADGWRMLAPPGADTAVESMLGGIWTQGFAGADVADGTPTVYRYQEATGTYAPATAGETWARGTGRFVYVYADDDPRTPAVDRGFPKTLATVGAGTGGPFTFALTRTPGNAEPDGPGWNLLGNPYDGAIDWDTGWTRAGVSSSVYVWDPAYLGGGYRVWNGTVGSLADGVIPAGNAFWVQATDAAPAVSVTEAARTASAPVVGRTAARAGLRLQLASADRPDLGAEAFLSLQPDATPGIDAADAWVLSPPAASYLTLGFAAGERALAIDARPATPGVTVLPLAVAAVEGGAGRREVLVLSWPALSPGLAATLVDTETGAETDLRQATSYRFELAAPAATRHAGASPAAAPVVARTVQSGRLQLHVASAAPTGTAAAPASGLQLEAPRPNPARADASVAFTLPRAGTVRVVVVDMLGHEVAVLADGDRPAGRHAVTLPAATLAAGVYAVRLDAGGETRTQRVAVVR